jgi:hypothetical protein
VVQQPQAYIHEQRQPKSIINNKVSQTHIPTQTIFINLTNTNANIDKHHTNTNTNSLPHTQTHKIEPEYTQ